MAAEVPVPARGDGAAGQRPRARVVIALGGNAISESDGSVTPRSQQRAVAGAMESVASLIADGYDVVLTHGNGPQVGDLLVKNEAAAPVSAPLPLDWCVAQTQATLGYCMQNALEAALCRRGISRPVATVLTRVLVRPDDPAFSRPTKPIGKFMPEQLARSRIADGETWAGQGNKGWRRVVASPQPEAILDLAVVQALLAAGVVVVAGGGGGVPVTSDGDGVRGVEAVLDKDLTSARLALAIGADVLVIATDVRNAAIHFGTPAQRDLGRCTPDELRGLTEAGHFAAGSMEPKVLAALRFVEGGGRRAVITSMDALEPGAQGLAGTIVEGG